MSEQYTYGRKWEVPFTAFKPCDAEFYASHETSHNAWTHYLTAPNGMVVVLQPDEHFGLAHWVLGGAGGYVGTSQHGDNLHLGTPGFCLAKRFIEAMESIEAAGIARPLPTKAVNSNGWTAEEEAAYALERTYGGGDASENADIAENESPTTFDINAFKVFLLEHKDAWFNCSAVGQLPPASALPANDPIREFLGVAELEEVRQIVHANPAIERVYFEADLQRGIDIVLCLEGIDDDVGYAIWIAARAERNWQEC